MQGLTLDKDALAQLAAHVESQCSGDVGPDAQLECIAHLLDGLDAGNYTSYTDIKTIRQPSFVIRQIRRKQGHLPTGAIPQ